MKIVLFFILVEVITPALVFAGDDAIDASTFVGSPTLWIAIIIGFFASVLTINFAFHMTGSTIGDILRPIGLGMMTIVIGLLAVVIDWADSGFQKKLHDLLFVAGYVMILIGVVRMRRLSA